MSSVPRCRLDKSVNTLTFKRALLALPALWHRMPLETVTWLTRARQDVFVRLGLSSNKLQPTLKAEVDSFYARLGNTLSGEPRQHSGIFEGSAMSGVILTADKTFDWDSLPAHTGKHCQHLHPLHSACSLLGRDLHSLPCTPSDGW